MPADWNCFTRHTGLYPYTLSIHKVYLIRRKSDMSNRTDKKQQRRALLKGAMISTGVIGAAQALPEKWLKPVINSVVLPAHGQTTDDTSLLGGGNTTTAAPAEKFYRIELDNLHARDCAEQASNIAPWLEGLADTLIPAAQAVDLDYKSIYYLEHLGGILYKFVYLTTGSLGGLIYYKDYASGNLNVGETADLPRYNCQGNSLIMQARLVSVTPGDNAVVELDGGCGGQYYMQTKSDAVAPQNVHCDDG